MSYCGIDFGTSNSAIGCLDGEGKRRLVALEQGKSDMPSTLFFDNDDHQTYFGRDAIERYADGDNGRFFRALKSILGSDLGGTSMAGRSVEFERLIARYLSELKQRAEAQVGRSLDQVVMGRPVQFVDYDREKDSKAQDTLENAAKLCGFKEVVFQFEPIAAALAYENQIETEQLALIVDIGAGTADFTVIKLRPDSQLSADRSSDILATEGVHVGGGDLDKQLSLKKAMPEFGYGTPNRHRTSLELPAEHYINFASWHRINELYQQQSINDIRRMIPEAQEKHLVERFMRVIKERRAHKVALEVEGAKILLSDLATTEMDFGFVEPALKVSVALDEYDHIIANECSRIEACMLSCVQNAGITNNDINVVFVTGGTSSVRQLQKRLLDPFTGADIVNGDRFGSVGLGLTIHASRVFA